MHLWKFNTNGVYEYPNDDVGGSREQRNLFSSVRRAAVFSRTRLQPTKKSIGILRLHLARESIPQRIGSSNDCSRAIERVSAGSNRTWL